MNENVKDSSQLPECEQKDCEKAKKVYCIQDIVFAWLCFLFGYLFCRVVPVYENTLGGFCFVLLVFAATYIILKIKKITIPPMALIIGASALIISPAIIITNSDFLIYLTYCYIVISYCYFVFSAFGNSLENGVSDLIFMDYIKAIFVMPFCSITKIFETVSSGKTKNTMKHLMKILSGFALAIIPTIVIFLLLSYDDQFISIFENIFDFNIETIFSHIASIIFAIPIGMYIFSLYYSSAERRLSDRFTSDGCNKAFVAFRILPQLTATTATLPILFVYIVYFISQWQYYISGFTGVLPESFSYAVYAREGFFQLCAVSLINLIVIIAIVLFTRRKCEKTSVLLKILTTVFCLLTLVLIATASAKLIMYINTYGLTQKRVYAMWFMALIAAVFIIIAIGKYVTKIKTIWTSLLVCLIFFTALALSNVNGIIAKYNIDKYLDGTLDVVDITAMYDLGDSSIPALVHLAEKLDERKENGEAIPEEMYFKLQDSLESKAIYFEEHEHSIFEFNIPAHRAKSALIKYGLIDGSFSNYDGWQTVELVDLGVSFGEIKIPPQWQYFEEDGILYLLDENGTPAIIEYHYFDEIISNKYYSNITLEEFIVSTYSSKGASHGLYKILHDGENKELLYLDVGNEEYMKTFLVWGENVTKKDLVKIANSYIAS